jgi:hypothetical protein
MRERVFHRILPLSSAGKNQTDLEEIESFDHSPPDFRDIPFRNRKNNFIDERGALKCADGMREDGDSGEQQVLFGDLPSHAPSRSTRGDDCDCLHAAVPEKKGPAIAYHRA